MYTWCLLICFCLFVLFVEAWTCIWEAGSKYSIVFRQWLSNLYSRSDLIFSIVLFDDRASFMFEKHRVSLEKQVKYFNHCIRLVFSFLVFSLRSRGIRRVREVMNFCLCYLLCNFLFEWLWYAINIALD